MTDLAIPGLAYAEANWGRWLARCPAGLCTNAVQIGRRQTRFECIGEGGCGWTSPIQWPADPDGIEMLLRRRPDAKTRNWEPGESLEDLLAENVAHGLIPLELDIDGPTTALMATVNGRITGGLLLDALPDADHRRALTTGGT